MKKHFYTVRLGISALLVLCFLGARDRIEGAGMKMTTTAKEVLAQGNVPAGEEMEAGEALSDQAGVSAEGEGTSPIDGPDVEGTPSQADGATAEGTPSQANGIAADGTPSQIAVSSGEAAPDDAGAKEDSGIVSEAGTENQLEDQTEDPGEDQTDAESVQEGSQTEPVVKEQFFQDALFIGDSRTVGLKEYGSLEGASFFASTGMSVYKIFDTELSVSGAGKLKLETLLQQQTFGKIYIMLGINELGYSYENTAKQYEKLVTRVAELQPEAELILEANMHVSAGKSASDPVHNNANIDRFNGFVQNLAEERGYGYINVNERFDDANGNLDGQYTADGSHILGKYYREWADWIYEVQSAR